MQKAHIGVQPHALQCGGAVPDEQRIGEGKQCICIVQRRPAAAAVETERLMLLQNQRIEAVEIPLGGFALQPEQLVRRFALFYQRQRCGQLGAGALQLLDRYALGVIPGGTLQHPAGIIHLAQNKAAGILAAGVLAVGDSVLGLAQQHIATLFPDRAGQKLSARAKKLRSTPKRAHLPIRAGLAPA